MDLNDVSIPNGVEKGCLSSSSDVYLDSPFQLDNETEPLSASSVASSSNSSTSGVHNSNLFEEDLSLPNYPLLEDIHNIEENNTSYFIILAPSMTVNSILVRQYQVYMWYLLFSWFGAFPGVSKQSFSHLLNILHKYFLSSDNTLPTNYASTLKMIKPYLRSLKEFHCCVNDCLIFRKYSSGDYSCLKQCPCCGENRYEENGKTPPKGLQAYAY